MSSSSFGQYTTREFQFEKQVGPSAEAKNGLIKKSS